MLLNATLIVSAVHGCFAAPAFRLLPCSRILKVVRRCANFLNGSRVSPSNKFVLCWNMPPDLWQWRECEFCSIRAHRFHFAAASPRTKWQRYSRDSDTRER